MPDNFYIKPVDSNHIDVFYGNGWDQWSRFRLEPGRKHVTLRLVKGSPMKPEIFKQLLAKVHG